MLIEEIRRRILKWEDFYGGDILDSEAVEKAKTKKELSQILDRHEDFMYSMYLDACSTITDFKRELNISSY